MRSFLEKEICIIGSGFCGYTAYKKLIKDNHDLILVEGGDLETPLSAKEQSNYQTSTNKFVSSIKYGKKIFNVKNLLDVSFRDRKYTVGGSSECWSGWIIPFRKDAFANRFEGDFASQNWRDVDISKFEGEGAELLNSPIRDFDPDTVANLLGINLPKLPKGLDYTVYSWGETPLRLKNYWSDKSIDNFKNISNKKNVLYGHKLIDFEIIQGKINSLIFENKKKDILKIKAKIFVLGMGGIENARFVKKLNEKTSLTLPRENIIGNFQEHPHLHNIAMFNFGKKGILDFLKWKIPISPSEDGKKGKVKFSITAWDGIGTPKVAFELKPQKNKIKGWIKSKMKMEPYYDCKISLRCEQTPIKSSNLLFMKSETKLDWKVEDSDFKYYSDYLKRFVTFLKSNDFMSDFKLSNNSFNDRIFPLVCDGGAHHQGTVPLTTDELIIDKNFRHSIFKNIYVVGCSSFPTSGFQNPTHAAVATTLAAVENIKINL